MYPDFPLTQYCRRLCVARLVGLAVSATLYALLHRGHITMLWVPILTMAIIEGLSLGLAQISVLRRFDARPVYWVIATILGIMGGHALAVLAQTGSGVLTDQATLPLWVLIIGIMSVASVSGLLIACFQTPALPPRMHSTTWIGANAFAWIPSAGLGVPVAAIIQTDTPLVLITLAGAGVGAVSGLLLGGITGYALDQADLPLAADHPLYDI